MSEGLDLSITLPYEVMEDEGSAKFDKTKRVLTVNLPVQRVREPAEVVESSPQPSPTPPVEEEEEGEQDEGDDLTQPLTPSSQQEQEEDQEEEEEGGEGDINQSHHHHHHQNQKQKQSDHDRWIDSKASDRYFNSHSSLLPSASGRSGDDGGGDGDDGGGERRLFPTPDQMPSVEDYEEEDEEEEKEEEEEVKEGSEPIQSSASSYADGVAGGVGGMSEVHQESELEPEMEMDMDLVLVPDVEVRILEHAVACVVQVPAILDHSVQIFATHPSQVRVLFQAGMDCLQFGFDIILPQHLHLADSDSNPDSDSGQPSAGDEGACGASPSIRSDVATENLALVMLTTSTLLSSDHEEGEEEEEEERKGGHEEGQSQGGHEGWVG